MRAHKSTLPFKTAWKQHRVLWHPAGLHEVLVSQSDLWTPQNKTCVCSAVYLVVLVILTTACSALSLEDCLENINQDIPNLAMYLNMRLWRGWMLPGGASPAYPKHLPRKLAVFSQTSNILCAKTEADMAHSRVWPGCSHTSNYCSKSSMKSLFLLGSCKVKSCFGNSSEAIKAVACFQLVAQAQPGAWECNAKGKSAALQHLCGVGQNHLPLPLLMWLGKDGPHKLPKRHSMHFQLQQAF